MFKCALHDTYITYSAFGAFGCRSRNTGASPFSFTISVLGSFTCITQRTGPTALRPIRRRKQLRLSVLLKDTSAAAGIQTHILTTPELESNALDRSATTLHKTYGSFHQVGARVVTSVNVPSIILDYKCTFTVDLRPGALLTEKVQS